MPTLNAALTRVVQTYPIDMCLSTAFVAKQRWGNIQCWNDAFFDCLPTKGHVRHTNSSQYIVREKESRNHNSSIFSGYPASGGYIWSTDRQRYLVRYAFSVYTHGWTFPFPLVVIGNVECVLYSMSTWHSKICSFRS